MNFNDCNAAFGFANLLHNASTLKKIIIRSTLFNHNVCNPLFTPDSTSLDGYVFRLSIVSFHLVSLSCQNLLFVTTKSTIKTIKNMHFPTFYQEYLTDCLFTSDLEIMTITQQNTDMGSISYPFGYLEFAVM